MVFRWWLEGKVGPRIARPGTLFPLGLTLSLPPWPPTVLTYPLRHLTPTYKEIPLDRIKTISIRTSSVSMSIDNLFLGLDLSTQQLKAILLNENGSLVHETSVHFDNDLPHYGTTNGAIQGPDEGEVTSPVAMWVEAVDLLLERMKSGGVEFGRIRGVSGAGQVRFPISRYHIRQLALTHFFDISQQHGSVFWSDEASTLLSSLNPGKSLKEQLFPTAFSIHRSPIWQDSSTTQECKELDEAAGGQQALADLTGSRAYERFTGPQIARVCRVQLY